jgi:hypothetical protein
MTFDQWAKGQMLLNDEIGLSYARRAWAAATDRAVRAAAGVGFDLPEGGYEASYVRATAAAIVNAIRSQDG